VVERKNFSLLRTTTAGQRSLIGYRFFHPPRCPGAPPLDRGAGPNSGPDWRESVGWKILVPPGSSGLRGFAPLGR
jgi:hypothetical protein